MGRQSNYLESRTAQTANSQQRLAEALLGAEMMKRGNVLSIRFDEPRDLNVVHKTLVGLRDAYTPPRK